MIKISDVITSVCPSMQIKAVIRMAYSRTISWFQVFREFFFTHRLSRLLCLTFGSFNLEDKVEQLVEWCEKIRTENQQYNENKS